MDRKNQPGQGWGWILALGIAFVLLGIVAFSFPIASTLGLTLSLGSLFIAAGAILGFHALQFRRDEGTGWRIVHSALALVAGFMMLKYPEAGMMTVAIVMTFYFFVASATRAMFAYALRAQTGSGWFILGAICSFFLGVYTVITFPVSALWIPGFLLGIDLVVHGGTLIGLSMDLRSLSGRVNPPPLLRHT